MGLTPALSERELLPSCSISAGWTSWGPGALGPSPPAPPPAPAELKRGWGVRLLLGSGLCASQCRAGRSGQTAPLPKPWGGGQSILLSPFSCSAISCSAPAPSMLHLLLLNHFLFTACLLQPPNSGSSQQPSKSSPDGRLDSKSQPIAPWEGYPGPSLQAA